MDTCLRRYDLILVHTYPCLRRYDEMPETQTLRRPCEGSGVTPAKAGDHLSNEVLKLALLTKAFAALTWIPACAGMTSLRLIPIIAFTGMTLLCILRLTPEAQAIRFNTSGKSSTGFGSGTVCILSLKPSAKWNSYWRRN